VTPLISIGGTIFSAETHYPQFSAGMHPADNLQIDIVYDTVVLGRVNFPDNHPQEVTFKLDDELAPTDHTLKFIFSGKTNNHSYHTDTNVDVSWLLKLELYIENLAVTSMLHTDYDTSLDFYVGQNVTHYLPLQTPIYGWLLQNDNRILNSILPVAYHK